MESVSFLCSGISSIAGTADFTAVSAKSMPLMLVCPQNLSRLVGSPYNLALLKCGDFIGYEGLVVMVCCVRWSMWLVWHGVEACLRVRENASPFIIIIFI